MSGFQSLLILTLSTLFLASCGIVRHGVQPAPEPRADREDGRFEVGSLIQEGQASWYGPKFHGKATANGEVFNMEDLTAAHRTLPFNTVVRVTNKANNRSVNVRINDRGPYIGDRIIDLSRRAAREIDMFHAGIGDVTLHLVEAGDRPTTASNSSSRESFTVQLGSYDSRERASSEASRIRGTEVVGVEVNNRETFRVYYGNFSTPEDAEKSMRDLRRRGYDGFVKQREN